MWRICRKTFSLRWHVNVQNPVENKNKFYKPKVEVCPVTGKTGFNDDSKGDDAGKHARGCWDDPNFHFSYRNLLLETAGWVGTAAALCINAHLKHFKYTLDHDRPSSLCLFPKNVLAMPRLTSSKEGTDKTSFLADAPQLDFGQSVFKEPNLKIRALSDKYVAAVENAAGISNLKSSERKAFRCFQSAARLGSSQALYNLGLCYESGTGTKINLQRAAFCYRQAAKKGHALASFNLAIFFMKGLGGLPVDPEAAKLLLAEAAEQGVLEAQLYLGIDFLENGKFEDAFMIFKNLKDCPDAQYYLGLCFENGWGIQKNEKVAEDLYSKAAVQGHEDASKRREVISKKLKSDNTGSYNLPLSLFNLLQKYKATSSDGKHETQRPSSSETSIIHSSASDPELTARLKTLPETNSKHTPKTPTPSYLDLIVPEFTLHCKPKASFPGQVNDQSLAPELSTTTFALSLSSLSHRVMEIKT